MKAKKEHCVGCDNNFYNGQNDIGVNECWNFDKAKTVKRLRIGWWTPQDNADNFYEVTTNSCHTATGKYADYDKLPDHLISQKRKDFKLGRRNIG